MAKQSKTSKVVKPEPSTEQKLATLEAEVNKELTEAEDKKTEKPPKSAPKKAPEEKETPPEESTPKETKPVKSETTEKTEGKKKPKEKPPKEQPPKEETPPKAKPKVEKKPPDKDEDLTDDELTSQLSEKAQRRFRQLDKQVKTLERELAFRKKFPTAPPTDGEQQPPPTQQPQPQPLPWDTQTKPEGEGEEEEVAVTEEEMRKTIREETREEMKKERILHRVKSDVKKAEKKYPVLSPQSENYDKVLATKISTWFNAIFKQNRNVRLLDFVDEIMLLQTKGAEAGKTEVTGKVLKQAAKQAITTTGPAKKPTPAIEKKIEGAKSMDELEAMESSIDKAVK